MTKPTQGRKSANTLTMKNDIKVVTFDLDNTLWDVKPTLHKAEQTQRQWLMTHRPGAVDHYDHESLWDFKLDVAKRHPQFAHQISKLRIQFLYELQRQAGFGEEESQLGAETAFAVFLNIRHQVVLYEEALAVLEQLARHYTLGALTNGNADIYKTDAAEYFDFAFLAEDLDASKPAPDMFHAAMAHTGANPQQIIHVGDHSEHDVAGAQAVGMHTVWVNLARKPWDGGERAQQEIENLAELPGAIQRIVLGHG